MKQFLLGFHNIPNDILEAYIPHWTPIKVRKKTIMTAPGDIERYWYYVVEGIQKSYYIHGDKTHVIAFTYPPSFTGIPDSFFNQSPSKYYLETITDTKLLRISFEKHQQLMNEFRDIETMFRKATESFLVGMLERYYQLMALDIESRFKAFVKRSPHLLGVIAQKDLASYLRIDATNFSKLMNNVKMSDLGVDQE